jgi:hypothetical protein
MKSPRLVSPLAFAALLALAALPAWPATAPGVASAPSAGDLLHSSACKAALAALQAQEDATAKSARALPGGRAASQPGGPALAAARAQAAQACLGAAAASGAEAGAASGAAPGSAPGAAARRALQPPISVAPAGAAARAGVAPGPGSPPPVNVPPLTTLGHCDAAGCWASDGTRLQRLGPALVGPRGVCSVQGSVLSCP